VDANGTAWRLRSLVAMGHDCARIARALGVAPSLVRPVVNGQASTVTTVFRAAAIGLLDAWWDKTPPRSSAAQRRAVARALRLAASRGWPAAAGLDEDQIDVPGYRPWCRYRPATGTGTAPDFPPGAAPPRRPRKEHRMITPTTRRTTGLSINSPTTCPVRRRAPARHVRAVITTLSARLHAAADTRAQDIGWTVIVMHGPLGLNGRSYHDPRFGVGWGGERHA
jgi:hypothetical protein